MSHVGKAGGDPAGSPPTPNDPRAGTLRDAEPIQPARGSRVKTLAPPPPLAAFHPRAAVPVAAPEPSSVARSTRSETAVLPQLVQPLESIWREPEADPYLPSLQPPAKPRGRPWGLVVAFGLGGLTAVAVGVALMMVQPTRQARSAATTEQRSGALTRLELTQPRLMLAVPDSAPSPPVSELRAEPVSARERSSSPPPVAAGEAEGHPKSSARALSPHASRSPRSAAVASPQPDAAEPSPSQPVPSLLQPAPRPTQPVRSDTQPNPYTASTNEVLPEQPSRDEIKRALEAIRPALLTCIGAAHGTTFANVTIASTGRVRHASIEGAFAGTTGGSCMARVLRSATVPRFSADSMTVRFPYVL